MSSCKLIIYHHFAAEILNTEYTDIYCQEIYTEYLKGTKEFTEGSLHYPLVGVFELCLSLCKTDSYKGICRTCYSSTPQNDCFLNKVAYLCKQKRKAPPDLPEPTVTDRREVKGRRQVCKYFAENYLRKESKVLILLCAHRHSSPFGEAGWGSSSPRGEECRSRDCPKKFQKLVLVCLEISVLSVKD